MFSSSNSIICVISGQFQWFDLFSSCSQALSNVAGLWPNWTLWFALQFTLPWGPSDLWLTIHFGASPPTSPSKQTTHTHGLFLSPQLSHSSSGSRMPDDKGRTGYVNQWVFSLQINPIHLYFTYKIYYFSKL